MAFEVQNIIVLYVNNIFVIKFSKKNLTFYRFSLTAICMRLQPLDPNMFKY